MAYQWYPWIENPQNDAALIWRYMDFTKLCSLLDQKALYFSSPAVLAEQDPYEGQSAFLKIEDVTNDVAAMTDSDVQQITNNFFRTRSSLQKYLRSKRETLQNYIKRNTLTFMRANFVNCWHMNEGESQAMWRIYAGDQAGVAIQTTVGNLRKSFVNSELAVIIGKIPYVDSARDAEQRLVFSNYMWKRKEFCYERELRALVASDRYLETRYLNDDGSEGSPERHDYYEVEPRYPNLRGVPVRVDLDVLIERIVLAPRSPAWFCDLVDSVTKKLGYSFHIDPSEVSRKPPLG